MTSPFFVVQSLLPKYCILDVNAKPLPDKEFNDEKATFQVLGDIASDYSIEVKEHTSINYDGLEFQPFYIELEINIIL